jgi:DNA-binding NarL/FixJ family response regulator
MIRVVLVSDQSSLRRGLRLRLRPEPDVDLVGEAADGATAAALARDLAANVVVVDAELEGEDAFAISRELGWTLPDGAIVLLGLVGDPRMPARPSLAGAVAFVAKDEGEEPLLAAIRWAAARGGDPDGRGARTASPAVAPPRRSPSGRAATSGIRFLTTIFASEA